MKNNNYKIMILLLAVCSLPSCKSNRYIHPVEYMYKAKYNKQRVMLYPAIDNKEDAETLALTYLNLSFKSLNNDFHIYESINSSLVNREDIWKIKIVRKEEIDGVPGEAHYYCYIRRNDGALLYTRREIGEWIGNTDLEDGYFKSHK